MIGEKLSNNDFDFPDAQLLPGTNQLFNSYFVADSAFPLTHNIMRPYLPPRFGELSDRKLYFNYRLGRARISIENAFGILAARWRIYHKTISCFPSTIDKIIRATVVLHNFIKNKKGDNIRYMPPGYADTIKNDQHVKGAWRKDVATCIIQPLPFDMNIGSAKYKRVAMLNREMLCSYISPLQTGDTE